MAETWNSPGFSPASCPEFKIWNFVMWNIQFFYVRSEDVSCNDLHQMFKKKQHIYACTIYIHSVQGICTLKLPYMEKVKLEKDLSVMTEIQEKVYGDEHTINLINMNLSCGTRGKGFRL